MKWTAKGKYGKIFSALLFASVAFLVTGMVAGVLLGLFHRQSGIEISGGFGGLAMLGVGIYVLVTMWPRETS